MNAGVLAVMLGAANACGDPVESKRWENDLREARATVAQMNAALDRAEQETSCSMQIAECAAETCWHQQARAALSRANGGTEHVG